VADHTLSVVTKYWIQDWKSQLGLTNSFSSGRPYDNPNVSQNNPSQFMNGKTKTYNSLSFSWAYLLSQQKILYFSMSNVIGTQNVFGYQYANSPDALGLTTAARSFPQPTVSFCWVLLTISDNKKDNQLNNL
jgi:hypothetical protein